MGLPPAEIDTAWTKVSFAATEAAQAFGASINGK
jgi:hypothetical protein